MNESRSCGGSCASCGGCGNCGGCGGELLLTPGEVRLLQTLGQIPFLPIARRADSTTPVYPEENDPEHSRILEALEHKGLITLDYDRPLRSLDDSAYGPYPIRGSMALTARGQSVIDLLEIQGIQEI